MAKLTNKQLIELAKRYKQIQAEEAKLGKEKQKIKDLLMNEMKTRNLKELLVDAYKILYSKYATKSFDSKKFQEEHAKMYEKYLIYGETEKVLVNLGK